MDSQGNNLSWLPSYLVPHSFNVSTEGNTSVDKPVTFSVPQGSVAGPILFSYYVGSLPDCIKHDKVLINRFADDHALHNSYQGGILVQRPIPLELWRTPSKV